MNRRHNVLLTAIAAFTLFLTGCGGSSSNTPPAITVSVSAPTSLTTGATASITATVSNNTSVNWTVTCGSSPCGSFNPASTPSGTATTYTAPATPNTVTITATSTSDSTKSGTATITIAAPPISVSLNPAPPLSITTGTTSSLTAVVTNDSQNKGVTWTVTCGSSGAGACGSFSPTSTPSGTATTYTAPTAVPTSSTVTVTATSVTDNTKSASATITIAPPVLSVSFNPAPPASITVGTTGSLIAVVSNDSKNGGVTWTVTCGSSGAGACGSLSPTSTASGTATTYTAPTTIPTNKTVTVTATSVTDNTKSASATITIAPILADGTYVYHFSGSDSSGAVFFTGAFSMAGGLITGGEQDFSNAKNGFAADPIDPTHSSVSLAGKNIQIVIATSRTTIGVNGVETLRGTAVSSSRVLISEFDSYASATGSIDRQTTPVATPSGGYAFVVSGLDIAAQINQFVIGGILNFSGTSLSITNSVFDYNVGGGVGQAQLFTSGSVTAPDSYGRVSFNLTPAAASGVPGIIFTGYIVSPSQIQLVESQSDGLQDDLGGVALGQGSKTNQFSQASVANITYVFAASGADTNNFHSTYAGGFVFNSAGGVSGNLAINDLVFFKPNTLSGGAYTVDPTGRVTISNVNAQPANAAFTFQVYLDGSGNALVLGADKLQVTSGPAFQQTSTSNDFEGNYALLGEGFLNNQNLDAWGAAGPVTLSSGNLTGSTDYNAQNLAPVPAQSLTGTENNSTLLLSLTGLDSLAFTSSRSYSYIPIDNKRVFAIEIDGNQLGLLTLESISH